MRRAAFDRARRPWPIHDEIRDLDLFVYGIPDIPGEGPPDGAVAECATRLYYAAEELYRAQHQRPQTEQEALVDKRFREQYDCYIDHGADLPFPISRVRHHQHQMLLLMGTYPACGSHYRAGSNAPLPGTTAADAQKPHRDVRVGTSGR